jgi:hypothetical protein
VLALHQLHQALHLHTYILFIYSRSAYRIALPCINGY